MSGLIRWKKTFFLCTVTLILAGNFTKAIEPCQHKNSWKRIKILAGKFNFSNVVSTRLVRSGVDPQAQGALSFTCQYSECDTEYMLYLDLC